MADEGAEPVKVHELTVPMVEDAIQIPFADWSHQCHQISIAMVKSDLFEYSRVARGSAAGVAGQHSWVTLGKNVYDPAAHIVDPTLWSYDENVKGIWFGTLRNKIHRPKGIGQVWSFSPPDPPVDLKSRVYLDEEGLSTVARSFLKMIGPLDIRGWSQLMNAPMQGWPSAEIVEAVLDHPKLKAFVPIDIQGMLTDRNPSGLYLKG